MSDEPLRTTTYILTSADALAYEQAAARMGPLATIALICWLGLAGAAALLIPRDWAGPRLSWSFTLLVLLLVAIAYVLVLLLMAVRQWRRARHRIRHPIELQLVEWPERLELSGAGLPRSVALAEITRVLPARTHVFLETASEPVILPARAFVEEGTLEALATRIAAAARAPATADEPARPAVVEQPATPPAP